MALALRAGVLLALAACCAPQIFTPLPPAGPATGRGAGANPSVVVNNAAELAAAIQSATVTVIRLNGAPVRVQRGCAATLGHCLPYSVAVLGGALARSCRGARVPPLVRRRRPAGRAQCARGLAPRRAQRARTEGTWRGRHHRAGRAGVAVERGRRRTQPQPAGHVKRAPARPGRAWPAPRPAPRRTSRAVARTLAGAPAQPRRRRVRRRC